MLGILVVALAWLASEEIQHSYYQSRFVSDYAAQLTHELLDGPSERVIYREYGPFDQRYGYTALPALLPRLQSLGYSIVSQAQFSDPLRINGVRVIKFRFPRTSGRLLLST